MPISTMGLILTSSMIDSPNLNEIYAARSHREIHETTRTSRRLRKEGCWGICHLGSSVKLGRTILSLRRLLYCPALLLRVRSLDTRHIGGRRLFMT